MWDGRGNDSRVSNSTVVSLVYGEYRYIAMARSFCKYTTALSMILLWSNCFQRKCHAHSLFLNLSFYVGAYRITVGRVTQSGKLTVKGRDGRVFAGEKKKSKVTFEHQCLSSSDSWF